jgi:alpha-1,2-mannosyltransferase
VITRFRWWLLGLSVVIHLLFAFLPARKAVWEGGHGRDFASYYYAYQVAYDGGDPYDTDALNAMARAQSTRAAVQPYFYPPPFLYTMAWVSPLSLATAYRGMLFLNEALLAACLFALVRGFGVPVVAVAAVLVIWSPIPDNAKMGQANLIALLPALLGLWAARSRPWLGGVLVGVAAMFKMSPALFLLYWAVRREWRPCVAAALTAVGLSLLSLPLCPLAIQREFYVEVLPGFGKGDYHGLTIPIALSANHSIPDIFNTLWPGNSKTALSSAALWASRGVSLAALGGWAWVARRADSGVPEQARVLGALTILMVILPTYTYEHHLVFLLLPAAVLIAQVRPAFSWRFAAIPVVLALAAVAWPLPLLNDTLRAGPVWLAPWVRESKFIGLVGMFVALLRRR